MTRLVIDGKGTPLRPSVALTDRDKRADMWT
jgi:hypothetical protein